MRPPHASPCHGSWPHHGADPTLGRQAPLEGLTPSTVPDGVICLADHAAMAAALMDPPVLAYVNGGAADEITLRENQLAWQGLKLRPRVLRPLAGGHTRVEVLGRMLPHPILVAPMAHQRLLHPHGEQASALAAAMQGAGFVLSAQANTALETVARLVLPQAERGPLWFQLYLQPDRAFNLELIRRVEAAGFEALVLTVDAPAQGARDSERRAGFALPPGLSAVNLKGMHKPPGSSLANGQSRLFDDVLMHAPTWADIGWLRQHTRLPILLKGITHPDDARLALEHGAAGLIVSNHGGRTLDTVPATAELLPGVVDVIAGEIPVLVDGGIRRGTDVLKAMALGASGVLIGRPVLHGLANAGAVGVAHVIRLLRDELEVAMALCGCTTLTQSSGIFGDGRTLSRLEKKIPANLDHFSK